MIPFIHFGSHNRDASIPSGSVETLYHIRFPVPFQPASVMNGFIITHRHRNATRQPRFTRGQSVNATLKNHVSPHRPRFTPRCHLFPKTPLQGRWNKYRYPIR